jgi:hypothetical protein
MLTSDIEPLHEWATKTFEAGNSESLKTALVEMIEGKYKKKITRVRALRANIDFRKEIINLATALLVRKEGLA